MTNRILLGSMILALACHAHVHGQRASSEDRFSQMVDVLEEGIWVRDRLWTLASGQESISSVEIPAGEIVGVVRTMTGQPLAGVQIFIPGTETGVLSDADGRFRLTRAPYGLQELKAMAVGYREMTIPLDLPENVGLRATLAMEELSLTFCDLVYSDAGPGAVRIRSFDADTSEPIAGPITLRVSDGRDEWQATNGGDGTRRTSWTVAGAGRGPFVFEVSATGYSPRVGSTPELPKQDCPPSTWSSDVWLLPMK